MPSKLECPHCGLRFSTLGLLKRHAKKHIIFNTCPICGRQFRRFSHLVQHIARSEDVLHQKLGIIFNCRSASYIRARRLLLSLEKSS